MASPRVSFESDDPERKESKENGSRPNSRRIAYADDNPRKKSIQFSVGGGSGGGGHTGGGATPQHRRSASTGDKNPTESKRKSHVEFQEKDPKQSAGGATSRGPSPPPPE